GLASPKRIVWCDGPLEIARHLAQASPHDAIGLNVKTEVFDQVQIGVASLAEIFWREILIAAMHPSTRSSTAVEGYDRCKAVSAVVNRIVCNAAGDELSRVSIRARHAIRRCRGLPRVLPRWNFEEVAVGPHELASLGVYEYLHDVLEWQEPTRSMGGLWKIARSAGWIVPHEQVCWISERPTHLSTD